jgi:negative regulator of flagellin synthesis FlgM
MKVGESQNASQSLGVSANSSVDKNKKINLKKDKASSIEAGEGVQVQLSHAGTEKELLSKKAYEIAKNTPDVDMEKVKSIKNKIEQGTYHLDSSKIADGMLKEAIKEYVATRIDEG